MLNEKLFKLHSIDYPKRTPWWSGSVTAPSLGYLYLVQSSKFFIPIKGPEGQTDSTATYTFIIKTHSIEQFNQNEITLQDCGIIIIYSVYIFFYNYYYTSSNMYKPRQSTYCMIISIKYSCQGII